MNDMVRRVGALGQNFDARWRVNPDGSDGGMVALDATVDPSAVIAPCAIIGPHASVGAYVSIGPSATVGAHATIGRGAVIGRGALISEHATICAHVHVDDRALINGHAYVHLGAVIGERALIGPHARIGPYARIGCDAVVGGDVVIGDDVAIGDGVRINSHLTLGRGVVIEEGSWWLSGGPCGSRGDRWTAVYTPAIGLRWWVGCQQCITSDELRRLIVTTHGGNRHAQDYQHTIAFVESHPGLARAMAAAQEGAAK